MYPPIFQLISATPMRRKPSWHIPADTLLPIRRGPRKSVTLPYAVWQTVGGYPENYLAEVPDVDQFMVQVDVYAATATSARSTAEAIRDAIEPTLISPHGVANPETPKQGITDIHSSRFLNPDRRHTMAKLTQGPKDLFHRPGRRFCCQRHWCHNFQSRRRACRPRLKSLPWRLASKSSCADSALPVKPDGNQRRSDRRLTFVCTNWRRMTP